MNKATINTAAAIFQLSKNLRPIKTSENVRASRHKARSSLEVRLGSESIATHSSTYLDLNSGLPPRKNSFSQMRVDFNCLPAQADLFSEKQPF